MRAKNQAYLLDRRMLRLQQQDWGDQIAATFQRDAKVQCVRRFGLPKAAWDETTGTNDRDEEGDDGGWGMTEIERHVTSVRMSRHVSHEVSCCFYPADARCSSTFPIILHRYSQSTTPLRRPVCGKSQPMSCRRTRGHEASRPRRLGSGKNLEQRPSRQSSTKSNCDV